MFLFFISSTTTVGVSLTQGSERQGFCKKKRSGRKPTPKEDEFQGVVWCIMADLYIIKTCFIEISMGDWEMLPASISSSSRTSSHSVS